MYDPVKDGVAKTAESVIYVEARPPAALGDLVHCLWELRTEEDLADDFTLLAMPDACVNLLFDQRGPRIAGVTQLHTTHATLDLGRSFDYAGIRFFPGMWRGDPAATVDHFVGEPSAHREQHGVRSRFARSWTTIRSEPVLGIRRPLGDRSCLSR